MNKVPTGKLWLIDCWTKNKEQEEDQHMKFMKNIQEEINKMDKVPTGKLWLLDYGSNQNEGFIWSETREDTQWNAWKQ